MYCATCGSQNKEDANFCRKCGKRFQNPTANPLPEVNRPGQEQAYRKLTLGIGFLIIASMLHSTVKPLSGWLVFLGIVIIVKGIRRLRFAACSTPAQLVTTPFNRMSETSAQRIKTQDQVRQTGELVVPSSVTEHTTKLFDQKKVVDQG
jgi:hypothetical protein